MGDRGRLTLVSEQDYYPGGESAPFAERAAVTLLALVFSLVVPHADRLGRPDLRGLKIVGATTAIASPVPEVVVVEFPLRGVWKVFQPPGHARHAFDFVALGEDGGYVTRSWWAYLLSTGPASGWHGWSQPVYAPLDGTVVVASDGWPNRDTVNMLRDVLRPLVARPRVVDDDIRPFAGNYVIIQSASAAALLAHLRRGSVRVSAGQRVSPGDVIGEVGNSGNSLAPHLHFQLMDGPDPVRARLFAFRLRQYERWNGTVWETVRDGMLAPRERIRSPR